MTTMIGEYDDFDTVHSGFHITYPGLHLEPGFLDLVNRDAITRFKNADSTQVPDSKKSAYQLPGCRKGWFKPHEKDENGNASSEYEHLGKQLIWDMGVDGGGYYSGGKIWAPDADKTYKSKMSLDGNTLTVKGCVAGGLVCRGQDWSRVN